MRLRTAIALTFAVASPVALLGSPASAGNGAMQVSGDTDAAIDCVALDAGRAAAADYSFPIQGDLNGCIYGVVTDFSERPSGTYLERADETFVSADVEGTFQMTELYTNKQVVPGDWSELQFARCKHPIVSGSGTGAFEGVSGRLDFKDNVDTGVAYYKGHLKGI